MSEYNWAPHSGDGWAQSTARHVGKDCPRCDAPILCGEVIVASGYSDDPIVWICRRHSNIEADRLEGKSA